MSSNEGYLVNAVSQAMPMWVIWRAIETGETSREELEDNTGLTSNQVGTALRGLRYLRLIEHLDEYQQVELKYDAPTRRLAFGMTALHNIAKECSVPPAQDTPAKDEEQWGKQAVLPLTFEYFIVKNRQYFDRKDNQELATLIDDWHLDMEFRPVDEDGERNKLNGNKFDNWARIAEFLGLVRSAPGTYYTVYLDPDLLLAILQAAADALSMDRTDRDYQVVDIRECFRWISERFFRISLTRHNEIPAVIAQSLLELSARQDIQLIEYSDADSVNLQGISRPASMDTATNSIEVRT
jgi:hypothetical protein